MKIYHTIPDNKNLFKNPVVTIGNFDGVHLGHKRILETLRGTAQKDNSDAVVITFSSHPRKVLNPEFDLHVITTSDEKVNTIYNYGIDNIILLNFTKEMANMSAGDFFYNILLKKIDIKQLVIGYDHAFGKDRRGDYGYLKDVSVRNNLSITRVEPVLVQDKAVSSSWIRDEIINGNFELVSRLLDRNYSISGIIVHGYNRGKELGFPTANIRLNSNEKLVPVDGVYAVKVYFDEGAVKYGMLNIGTNPTFSQKDRSIEVHIFDLDENLYDSTITVEFIQRIRDEMIFDGPEELIRQMHNDEKTVRAVFKKEDQE